VQLAPIQTISISNSALTKTSNSLFKLETMPRTYWYWTVPPTTRLPRAAPNSGLIDSMRLDWTSSDATVSARSGCFRPTLALSQRSTPQIFYFRNRICPRVLHASGVPLLSLRPVFLMRGTIDGLIAQGTRSMKNTSSDRSRKSPQRYIP